jgi:hypothetical protein
MYNFQNPFSLDIQASYCTVILEQSTNNNCTVDIKGTKDQVKDFSVTFSEGEVNVTQKSSNSNFGNITIGDFHIGKNYVQSIGGFRQSNGVNINQSGGGINISGVSGSVTINGKKINLSDIEGDTSVESNEAPVVTIKIPKVDCTIELSNIAELQANLSLGEVDVELSGTAKTELYMCDSLKANLSGTSSLKATIANGSLYADTSGCSSLQVYANSTIESVKADSSGTSSIYTNGTVKGNYKAVASGCAKVSHSGVVQGKVKKSTSGMGKINVG